MHSGQQSVEIVEIEASSFYFGFALFRAIVAAVLPLCYTSGSGR